MSIVSYFHPHELCPVLSPDHIHLLTSRAIVDVKRIGYINSLVFTTAVLPLLAHFKPTHGQAVRHAARLGLFKFTLLRHQQSDHSMPAANHSSAAARCAIDSLCIIFSMLPIQDFLTAQRCCRSWRAVRLRPCAWPISKFDHVSYMLRRESEEDHLNAAHCIRKLLETNMYMEQITNDTATIKRLLYLLETTQHFPIKMDCLWALRKIMSVQDSAVNTVMVGTNALQLFISATESENEKFAEQAVMAVSSHSRLIAFAAVSRYDTRYADLNLAAYTLQIGIAFVNCNRIDTTVLDKALHSLVTICTKGVHRSAISSELLRTTVDEISNLSRRWYEHGSVFSTTVVPAIMQLLAVTKDESVMISILSLFASSVKTDDGRSITIQRIHRTFDVLLHNDAAFMLVALLKHSSTTVQERTFQIIGIILSNGNETHIQLILDANVLPIMRSLLLLPNESIRGKTCLALSNIMVEPNNIEKAIAADLFPLLLHLINVPHSSVSLEVQKEVGCAIRNAIVYGNTQQVYYLVGQGVIKLLCDLLSCSHLQFVIVALEGMNHLLDVGQPTISSQGGNQNNAFAQQVVDNGGLEQLKALLNEAHSGKNWRYKRHARTINSIISNYFASSP